jgi:thioesterase domain-containing protein/acyl carrier protein
MVPAAVVVLEALPLTPNGKLHTRALPAPEYTPGEYRAPSSPTEEILAGIYAQVLGLERVGVDDSFFELGGDSLLAMRVIAAANTSLDAHLPVRAMFEASTVRTLSHRLQTDTASGQEVIPVETLKTGTGVPLFCIHPSGGVSWQYQALGNYLDCPIVGIQQILRGNGADPRSVCDMAKNYADKIQGVDPTGPYNLLGWSFGGVVAHEIAIELQRRGSVVAPPIVLDTRPTIDTVDIHALSETDIMEEVVRFCRIVVPEQDGPLTYERVEELIRQRGAVEFSQYKQLLDSLVQNHNSNVALHRAHDPGVFDGDIVIFSAARNESDRGSTLLQSWRPYVTGDISVYPVDCTHQEMLTTESLTMYGKQLKQLLTHEESTDVSGLHP